MVEQGTLGQNQIRSARDAEVGASVTHYDRQLARRVGDEVALAGARQRLAIAAGVREGEAPAIVAAPFQMVGVIRQLEAMTPQDHLDHAIEPVRYNRYAVAQSSAKFGEGGKFGIDFDTGHELVHFGLA